MPVSGSSIREILMRKDLRSLFGDILLNWLIFGPSGHDRRPDGLVIENYTWRIPDDAEANRHVKSLVRTKDLTSRIGSTPHIFDVRGPTCNARGETVLSYAMQPVACHDVMVINHYFTKSVRGVGTQAAARPRAIRSIRTATGSSPTCEQQATVEDTRALRFVPRLRALLAD